MEATFEFTAELYLWEANGVMLFVDVPLEIGEMIQDMPLPKRGFGSVKVRVRCGSSEWRTSVFPSKESGSYVLPVKKPVRVKEQIDIGDTATFEIDVAPE